MTGRIMLLVGLCVATCAGCLYRRANTELLESELRWMEDQMYMLEDELQLKQKQLADCQASNRCDGLGSYTVIDDCPVTDTLPTDSGRASSPYEVLPSESAPALRSPAPSSQQQVPTPAESRADSSPEYEILDDDGTPRFAPDRSTTEPPKELDLQIDGSEGADDEDGQPLSPPEVTLPPETDPSSNSSPGFDEETAITPRTDEPGRIRLSSHDTADQEATADPVDAHVTHIVVQAWLAHGEGFDGEERDADLLVCVEPRNADGAAVPLGSQLSLVVLDASRTGEDARVARWDYTASEARRLLKRSAAGHGIHLELPWPDEVPTTDDLHIFARYVTVEDQFLEADARVKASYVGGESVQRTGWQRAPSKRPSAAMNTPRAKADSGEQLTRPTPHKIRLRPIPKTERPRVDRAEADQSARLPRTQEQPTILLDEKVPLWRPER